MSAEIHAAAPAPAARQSSARRVLAAFIKAGLLPTLLIILVIAFAAIEPRFLSSANLLNISRQSVYLLLIALGQMAVLVSGHFDLSVGATLALASVVAAMVMTGIDSGPAVQIVAGALVGTLVGVGVGLANGFIIGYFHVPAFMVTLGTTSIAFGLALLLSKGVPITGIPTDFTRIFGTGRVLGIPVPIFFGIIAVGLMYVLLYRTTLGRNMYAVGGNEDAAHLAGIPVRLVVVAAFVVCGALAAFAGVLLTARVGSGEATLGGTFMLLSIAAAVLGGTSLYGGEGRLSFVVLGVIFLGVLSNGMNLVRITSYVQELTLGVVLIVAVITDQLRERAQS